MATVINDAGRGYITSLIKLASRPGTEPNYIGHGTTATDDTTSRTALIVEVDTRANGTSSQTGTNNNTYRTVGTITAGAGRSIVEAATFSASSAGTMLSRSTFTAVALNTGDSIQYTYDVQFA